MTSHKDVNIGSRANSKLSFCFQVLLIKIQFILELLVTLDY